MPSSPDYSSDRSHSPDETLTEESGDSEDSEEFSDATDSPDPSEIQVQSPPQLPASQATSEAISATYIEEEMDGFQPVRSSARTGARRKEILAVTAPRGRARQNKHS